MQSGLLLPVKDLMPTHSLLRFLLVVHGVCYQIEKGLIIGPGFG